MNRKYWLLCLPIAVGFAFFGPSSSDGWSSACGCLNDDAEFAYFVTGDTAFDVSSAHVELDTQLNEEMVASGFLAKIPVGSSLKDVKARSSFMANSCNEESTRLYRCDYWLQFNSTVERGYSIAFHLSDGQLLTLIEAKKIVRERKKSAA